MASKHIPPERGRKAFSCPHCGAHSSQQWKSALCTQTGEGVEISTCQLCKGFAVWVGRLELQRVRADQSLIIQLVEWRMEFPSTSTAPLPSEEMPKEIEEDYLEARAIVGISPRGAAALLRLCIQKLTAHLLGTRSKKLNDDIGILVSEGLPQKIQKALDSVRVIGNEAVHPGTMDLRDDKETALAMFGLINLIVEQTITVDKKVGAVYGRLPQSNRDAIARRDGKHPAENAK